MPRFTRNGIGLLLGLLTLVASNGCSTELRDAAQAGLFDYVSGSVTELLGTLFPVTTE